MPARGWVAGFGRRRPRVHDDRMSTVVDAAMATDLRVTADAEPEAGVGVPPAGDDDDREAMVVDEDGQRRSEGGRGGGDVPGTTSPGDRANLERRARWGRRKEDRGGVSSSGDVLPDATTSMRRIPAWRCGTALGRRRPSDVDRHAAVADAGRGERRGAVRTAFWGGRTRSAMPGAVMVAAAVRAECLPERRGSTLLPCFTWNHGADPRGRRGCWDARQWSMSARWRRSPIAPASTRPVHPRAADTAHRSRGSRSRRAPGDEALMARTCEVDRAGLGRDDAALLIRAGRKPGISTGIGTETPNAPRRSAGLLWSRASSCDAGCRSERRARRHALVSLGEMHRVPQRRAHMAATGELRGRRTTGPARTCPG